MSQALAQLERDGRINAEERKERVRQYLAQLDEQEERHVQRGREEGREEGRRQTLLELLRVVDPHGDASLAGGVELDAMEERLRRLLMERANGG